MGGGITFESDLAFEYEETLQKAKALPEALGIRQAVESSRIFTWLLTNPGTHHASKIMVSDENLVLAMRPNPYTPEQIQAGFHLLYSNIYRNETSPLVRHKTLIYGDCILEKRRAKDSGVHELIFLQQPRRNL